jgi:YggT family protein
MSGYLANPVVFLIQTLLGVYAAIAALRFLLQWVRADFYNPMSQFIVKLTTPLLRHLRRIVPSYAGLDLASLVLAWLVKTVELAAVVMIVGLGNPLGALLWSIPALVTLFINIFLFAVLIQVILSWVNTDPYNPAVSLLERLTAPVLDPARRLIPAVSGLDLSPMVVMIALVVLEMLLVPPLNSLTGSPF